MISQGEIAFKAILKIAATKIGEDVFFKGFHSFLGMLFTDGFRLALGNFAILISIADLVTYLAKTGYQAYNQVRKAKISGTTYDVRESKSGVLIAENKSIATLRDFPIQLPQRIQFPTAEITSPTNLVSSVAFRQLDSQDVFRALRNLYSDGDSFHCPECSKVISVVNGMQIGHASVCSKNNNLRAEYCDECNTDLTKYSHKPSCPKLIWANRSHKS